MFAMVLSRLMSRSSRLLESFRAAIWEGLGSGKSFRRKSFVTTRVTPTLSPYSSLHLRGTTLSTE